MYKAVLVENVTSYQYHPIRYLDGKLCNYLDVMCREYPTYVTFSTLK
jgi:hypothetical protein